MELAEGTLEKELQKLIDNNDHYAYEDIYIKI